MAPLRLANLFQHKHSWIINHFTSLLTPALPLVPLLLVVSRGNAFVALGSSSSGGLKRGGNVKLMGIEWLSSPTPVLHRECWEPSIPCVATRGISIVFGGLISSKEAVFPPSSEFSAVVSISAYHYTSGWHWQCWNFVRGGKF